MTARRGYRLLLNYFVYVLPFWFFHYLHYGRWPYESWGSYTFFWIYTWNWLAATLISRKISDESDKVFGDRLFPVFVSFVLLLGLFSLFHLFIFGKYYSRSVFIFSIITGFLIEALSVVNSVGVRQYFLQNISQYSISKFLREIILLTIVFSGVIYTHRDSLVIDNLILNHIGIIFFCWFISGIVANHFIVEEPSIDQWRIVWRVVKLSASFFLMVSFAVFYFATETAEQHVFLKSVILYICITLPVNLLILLSRRPRKTDIVEPKILRAPEWEEDYPPEIFETPEERYNVNPQMEVAYSFREKLKTIYLSKYTEVFDFLSGTISLDELDINRAVAVRTNDLYNVDILPDDHMHFFCNLLELNHIRRINEYLIAVNSKLSFGGVLVGVLEPANLRFARFMQTYPYYLARIFYFFDFMWNRVSPKLPGLKGIYFTLTKGRRRAISLAEGLGRLYFCGYEVLSIREIKGNVYFIARKTGQPKEDINPSYGPLFKMRRVGQNGKIIYVYKLRTMHPYSEYLQKFVFEHNQLQEGGKFSKDFRVTSWGKVLRKLWIDELPMLINFIKGDLKLVGVRPLSQHYISLYSEELRESRKKFKPGLVPPFYVDMPKSLDEIMKSELKYMRAYEKHPFRTDIKYFFGAAYNIIFKKARSK